MIEKAGNAEEELPSLTLMTMPVLVVAVDGAVPESWPVAMLKLAHEGFPWMLNESASPLASAAVGVKLYAAEAITDVAGLPEMVGAVFVGAGLGGVVDVVAVVTRMEKGGSDDESVPSLALTTIFWNVASMPSGGTPVNSPERLLKLPQEGLLRMLKRIRSPFASVATARNV